jgi:hypothetical protein
MPFFNPSSPARKGKGATIWLFCAVMASGFTLAPQARADFLGYYDFNNFTQSSTSDGSAYTPDSGLTVVVVGGNSGSGLPGTTTLLINAPASGTVQFDYLYNSLDSPTFDSAGYVLNGVYSQLANADGQSGDVSFSVNAGDSFGFEVWTADNLGEPGIVTVSNFNAPAEGADSSNAPEPGTVSMFVLAGGVVAAYLRFRRGHAGNEGKA